MLNGFVLCPCKASGAWLPLAFACFWDIRFPAGVALYYRHRREGKGSQGKFVHLLQPPHPKVVEVSNQAAAGLSHG